MVTITNSKGQNITFWYSSTNIHIKDSYKISAMQMNEWLNLIRQYIQRENGYIYTRSNCSWIREWKAHNLLYRCKFKTNRTADVDLNEDEYFFRQVGYFILSLFS